jgi:signal transduction histidine kinase
MISAHPTREVERISELRRYCVLDTPPEDPFDDLTKLAAYVCGTPIALVSLVDAERVWFKSKVGLAASEIRRIDGFCSSAVQKESLLIVPDAAEDERLAGHPFLSFQPKVRFYAGAPLITPRGLCIGTLCVIDTVPRRINEQQTEALEKLARTVVRQLEQRSAVKNYEEAQRTLQELQTRTETRVQQRTEQLASMNASLQKLSGQLIRAQDDERRRIARDLHDSTGQVLAALSMSISRMQRRTSAADRAGFEECRELIDLAVAEVRNLSYLLHPPLMDEVGLASAVVEYAQGVEKRSGVSVKVEVSREVGRLDGDREIALFRIIQESLGNILRHSGSPMASVKVFCNENDVVLEIRDQGRGLPSGSGETLNFGVGIRSMQERLRQFGGTLQIESNGSGTNVRAVLPRQSSVDLVSEQTA